MKKDFLREVFIQVVFAVKNYSILKFGENQIGRALKEVNTLQMQELHVNCDNNYEIMMYQSNRWNLFGSFPHRGIKISNKKANSLIVVGSENMV